MKCSSAQVWVIGLGCLLLSIGAADGKIRTIEAEEACVDFAAGAQFGSAWTPADCAEVWTQFLRTVPTGLRKRQRYADLWRETATELRRAGTPCLASSNGPKDGVGSTTIRILSSRIFAEEMGCDWVVPDWGRRHVEGGNGTVLYCHRTVAIAAFAGREKSSLMEKSHCSIVDWLAYFRLDASSVRVPEGAKLKEFQISTKSVEAIELAKAALEEKHSAEQSWDRIMFKHDLSFAGRNFIASANWDEERRERVRAMVGQLRENFHVHPRPWYDENPECAYDPAKLNFAIHLRMGDRPVRPEVSVEYLRVLELFMGTLSEAVVSRGLEPPLFHVFSETLIPCPSEDAGLFDEFPSWPVHQVPECLTAEAPDDCPEKQAGASECRPDRPGLFDVIGVPAVLHVGPSVHNALSCMIQADGLLMGCSTFGQIAGIFSKGISFFSMNCNGVMTPAQYKTIPPIAVAERGHMWVPVGGSWHDPVLNSTDILNNVLDTHLLNKGWV